MTKLELLQRKQYNNSLSILDLRVIIERLIEYNISLPKDILLKYREQRKFTTGDLYKICAVVTAVGYYIKLTNVRHILNQLVLMLGTLTVGSTVPIVYLADSATYNFSSTTVGAADSTWTNLNGVGTPSKNIIYNSSGLLPSEGTFTAGSITQHFADGPNYTSSAARINLNAHAGGGTSGSYYKPFFDRPLPVGNYTFRCMMKSNSVGVTQLLRWGMSTAGATTIFSVTDIWTQFSIGFSVANAGSNNGLYIAAQIGLGAMTVIVDEFQLYNDIETVPVYTLDGNDGHISKPYGVRNPITKNGNYVTADVMAIHSPQYPLPKAWAEMTLLFAIRITSDTDQGLWAAITDSFYGSLNNINLTITSGEPTFSFGLVNGSGKLTDQDFVIVGASFNVGASNSYVNEVTVGSNSGKGTINAQIFSLMGRLPSTVPLLGDMALCTIWDRKLTSSEWATAVSQARSKLGLMSAPYRVRNWYIAHGDSISVAYIAPQGPSFAYQMGTSLFTGGEYLGHVNLATGGYTLSLVEGGLSAIVARVAEAKLGGGKAIVSILVGRNDNTTLISTAACDAYWVRLKTLYAAIRASGAKLIAITPLPSGTAAVNGGAAGSWETYRNYLSGLMRADPAQYDALADFANPAISIMGDVATADNLTYYVSDGVHPMKAGHDILAAVFKPIVQTLLA